MTYRIAGNIDCPKIWQFGPQDGNIGKIQIWLFIDNIHIKLFCANKELAIRNRVAKLLILFTCQIFRLYGKSFFLNNKFDLCANSNTSNLHTVHVTCTTLYL